jgi:hypothetical protein
MSNIDVHVKGLLSFTNIYPAIQTRKIGPTALKLAKQNKVSEKTEQSANIPASKTTTPTTPEAKPCGFPSGESSPSDQRQEERRAQQGCTATVGAILVAQMWETPSQAPDLEYVRIVPLVRW